MSFSGGCQCGAIRFKVESLGRASICHCRMCQKATGNFVGPFVTVRNEHLAWTRGALKHFQSSNKVRRGFCANCGTPLTYEIDPDTTELSIGAFDDPACAPPVYQLQVRTKVPYFDGLPSLPERPLTSVGDDMASYQHPDHDTDKWPP